MRYLPHTDAEVGEMLQAVGAASLDELFASVPAGCRTSVPLDLPEPLGEWDLLRHLEEISAPAGSWNPADVFLGAGSYDHFIPEAVNALSSRSEFLTSYTPYQPEVSQGTLQAIYEYQTLAARLLGMEVANASLYDGATALVEAALMAIRVTGRRRVAVSAAVHPLYRRVLRTYLESADAELLELPVAPDGGTDGSALGAAEDLAAVAVQSPNFFGCIEDLGVFAPAARAAGALTLVAFTEPIAYGLLKSPGSQGADVACGEGQSLGLPMSYGGPGLGVFTARREYMRHLPGRLVGRTLDREGREGFVLTLATREQHIRRERATSNICSNQSWCALRAAMYLATLGPVGLRELARLNRDKAEYLKSNLAGLGLAPWFSRASFNEFVVRVPADRAGRLAELRAAGTVPGLELAQFYPELEGCLLVCATETKTRRDLDRLVEGWAR